jgi:hypothetical protein
MAADVQLRKNKRISLRKQADQPAIHPHLRVVVNAVEVFFEAFRRLVGRRRCATHCPGRTLV